MKLNKCKIRVGDKITALYIGNPITENYPTDEWDNLITLSNSLTINTCKTPATNGILLEYSNGDGKVKDLDIANLEDFDTKRSDRIYLGQYGNRQIQDNIKSQKDCIIYFTKPLTVTLALSSNPHFDEDFQGIVAFTNTDRVNTGTFDPTSDNPAGQKSIEYQIIKADIFARFANAYSHIKVDNSVQYAFAWLPYSDLDLSFIDVSYLYYGSGIYYAVNGNYLFNYCRYLKKIPYNPLLDNILSRCSSLVEGFGTCTSLEMVGEYSLSTATNLNNVFVNCGSLKHIHLKNIPVSLNISSSTRFEEANLVEIIGNLADLTGKTSQTLTMGATNLAKLTDAEKAVAINKNWVLA